MAPGAGLATAPLPIPSLSLLSPSRILALTVPVDGPAAGDGQHPR
jgi:hypothetical protein